MSERSVHIFLIDYNIMSFTAKRLKEMYFKVTAVSSNFEAQKLISQPGFNAEIILVDLDSVNMSDPTFTMTNGLALLRRLVVAVASKNIPIIGLSNIDDQDLMQRIIDSGARELLTLPIHRGARETLLKHGRLCHHLNRSTSSRIEKVKAKDGTSRILDDSDSPITVKTEGTTVSQVQPNSNLTGNTSSDNEKYLVQLRSANPVAQHVVSNGQQKHSAVGTIHFMAPEVIFEHKYGRSVDWWACGVTFYECTVRHHLFNGLEKDAIIMQILMAPIELDPISQHSPLLQNLVGGLLVRDPNLRMGTAGAKTIMKHDFFREIDWKTISESNPDYKPALLVNQRHSVTDKILFYGETQASKPKHLGTNSNNVDIRRTSVNSASHPRKRHANILNMRQRQDDFQKLTAQRKDWMSGSHVRSDINGEKRLDNANLVKKQSFDMFSNSLAAASLGIMNASLDWSITMLPEEDSSASEDEEEAENGVEGEQECEEEKEDYEMEEQEEEEQEEEELEKEEEKTEVEKGEESNLADGGKVEIEKNR
jgi:CheY-like chemotaxis protein